ncbi:MAG: TIGR00153 family protein [Deltaproteobacteria bacterium]|nr:MAG: TIGR00153 family protein [Deltaproteobacteria bacterium]HEC32265.1 TIGR00153 family protein [Deltaproteobacteria bacterium]
MLFSKYFSRGKKEEKVLEKIRSHIELLCKACELFSTALQSEDTGSMRAIIDLEREADGVKRKIISGIYEGAFLPYLRPDLCRFVETVDDIFDMLEDTAFNAMSIYLPHSIREESFRVAFLNSRMCEMLLITFDAMVEGEDLRERVLAIRIYEKKIDDMKFGILCDLRELAIDSYWYGKALSDFVTGLTSISDIIEDACDHLQIIHLSMR